jgi:hypothetical protein
MTTILWLLNISQSAMATPVGQLVKRQQQDTNDDSRKEVDDAVILKILSAPKSLPPVCWKTLLDRGESHIRNQCPNGTEQSGCFPLLFDRLTL